jgi:peroxiredoxin
MKNLTISALLLALTLGLTAAESTPLKIGDRVPDVVVQTVEGAGVALRAELAGQPSVVIFYRGGWCPYCVRHLAALAEVEADLLAAGFKLVALSPDRPAKLREKPALEKLNYILLSDSPATAARAFGLAFQVPDELVAKYKNEYKIDLEGDSGQTHHLLPHPAVFIVDAGGIIRFVHFDPDYRVRLTPEKILAAAKTVVTPQK